MSWKLTTEFNYFESTAEFEKEPYICTPALKIVMENGAHSPCHYGKRLGGERSTMGYNFVHWDSHQAHVDVTDNTAIMQKLGPALKPCLAKSPTMCHVLFSGAPVALDKPFTQVTKLSVNTPFPENRTKVATALLDIATIIGTQFVFGPTYEDANKYIVIYGQEEQKPWDEDQKLAAQIKDLFTAANKDFNIYTKLVSYAKPVSGY